MTYEYGEGFWALTDQADRASYEKGQSSERERCRRIVDGLLATGPDGAVRAALWRVLAKIEGGGS